MKETDKTIEGEVHNNGQSYGKGRKPFRDALLIKGKKFADLGDAINLGVELRRFEPTWSSWPITTREADFLDEDFLERFRKESFEDEDLSRYSIRTGSYRNKFLLDSPYGFFLHWDEMPIATMAFEPQPNAILATQMQGKYGMKSKLAPLRWPNALLNAGLEWAGINQVPEVWVLPHDRNIHASVRDDRKGTKMLYDVTARREGFEYDDEKKVYVKKLE